MVPFKVLVAVVVSLAACGVARATLPAMIPLPS